MEIVYLSDSSIKIRSKRSSVVINPLTKASASDSAIILGDVQMEKIATDPGMVLIYAEGEYEIGGIKISGIKNGENTVFSLLVDGIDILLGEAKILAKPQAKLKEHHMVIAAVTNPTDDGTFIAHFSPSVALFYGHDAQKLGESLNKEALKKTAKYQISVEKLPQEMETIVLQ